MLNSVQPVFIAWGDDLFSLYNDACLPLIGRQHPAVGMPFVELWREVADQFRATIAAALAGGAQHVVDLPVSLGGRSDLPVNYFTFAFTPLRDDEDAVRGLYITLTETTGRVLAEQRRGAEDAQFRAMFEQVPSVVFTTSGPDHVLDFVNATHRRLFDSADWVGQPARAFFPASAGQRLAAMLDHVYTTGEPLIAMATPVRVPGMAGASDEERILDFTYAALRDADGRIVGIFCEGQDVTAQHQARAALEQNETRLRLALAASDVFVWESDSITGEVHWGEGAARLLGLADDALPRGPNNGMFFVAPHEHARVETEFAISLATRAARHVTEFEGIDGRRWHAESAFTYAEDGALLRAFGNTRDVTRKRIAEDALRASEGLARAQADELAAVYHAAPVGLCVLDRELRYVRANDRLAEINGRPAADHIGKTVGEMVPDLDAQAVATVRKVLDGQPMLGVEITGTTPAQPGVERVWHTNWLPMHDGSGNIVGITVSAEEVTEEKAAKVRSTLLLKIMQALQAAPRDALDATARIVSEHFGVSRVGFGESGDDGLLHVRTEYGDGTTESAFGAHRLDDFGVSIAEALRAGRTVVIDDVTSDPRTAGDSAAHLAIGTRSVVTVPLLRDDRLHGTFYINHREPRHFSHAEVSLFEDVASRAWAVLNQAQTEARLHDSEARLDRATAAAGVGIWDWNLTTGITRVNAQYFALYGLPADGPDPSFEDWVNIVHPEDRERAKASAIEALAGDAAYRSDYRIIRADTGEVRWMSACGQALRGPDGEVQIFTGINMDVTNRKALEADLVTSEEQLRATSRRLDAVLSNATVAVFLMDERQHCSYMNRAAEQLTGYSFAETQGRPLHDVIHHSHPDGRHFPIHDCAIDRAFPENADTRGEAMFVHKDGSFYPIAFVASPFRDEASRTIGTIIEVRGIAEEKAAQQALADSELRYRAVFEQAGVGVARVALDGPFLEVNDRYCTILGRSRAELIGKGWREITHPDDLAADVAQVERLLAGDARSFTIEKRYVDKNGDDIWVNLTVALVRDAADLPVFFVAVAEDIGARRRAEVALAESEAQLRAVIDSAPVGLVFADANGRVTGGNARIEEITGHQLIGSSNVDAYGDWISYHADGRRVQARDYPMARVLSGERDRDELEVLYQRGDGRNVWVRFIGSAVRDANGALLGGVVASLDIDREKRLTDELAREVQEALAERDRLWASTKDLLMIARFDGKIDAVNPAWAEALGWSENDLVDTQFWDLIHPDDLPAAEAYALALASGGKTAARFECRYRAIDGTWHWLDWSVSSTAGMFNCVARDVTDDKQRQAELDATRAHLHEAQKLETIGQLTGGVAHDFNNLLTPIMGVLEIMERRVAGEDRMSRLVSGALQSAERAKNLVQRLLAFARRQHLETRPVDLAALIDGMRDLINRSLGPTIDVEVEVEPSLCPGQADPNQLELALLNLSVNARDAMPDGGTLRFTALSKTVDIDNALRLTPGDYIQLAVADTGSGMDAETLNRCIEPFFTSKGVGEGTGLGLSMVHGMMGQLGGALEIASVPAVGTTMTLWLPCANDPAQHTDTQRTAPIEAQQRATILLVDDDDLVRESTADLLVSLGYDVELAHDGDSALALLAGETQINALVTDYLMPGMTGRELAERAGKLRSGLPVLIITGYSNLDDIGSSYARLQKPFHQSDFAARVAELVSAA